MRPSARWRELRDGSPPVVCHDYMTEEPQADDRCRRLDSLARSEIRIARVCVPARVIVRHRKRTAVVAENRIQDLAYGGGRAIDCAFGDLDCPPESVAGVAYEHDQAFLPGTVEERVSGGGDVGRAAQLLGLHVGDPPAQLEGGD